jgi:acyl carrier protein
MLADMDEDPILPIVAQIIRDTFHCPFAEITRETTAMDIDGWDSLSHTDLIMAIEDRFGVELPADQMFDLEDVGELVDLIANLKGRGHG